MSKTISTEQIKAQFPEAIESTLTEDYLLITRCQKPIAAIVSYEDLKLLQRTKTSLKGEGLANIADNWEDADDFAQELDKVREERYQVIPESE